MRKAVLLSAILSAVVYQAAAMLPMCAQATEMAPGAKSVEPDPNRPVRDKWALVIGITQFANNKVPPLRYSTKDAADFYNYLINDAHFEKDHVRLLLNEKATQRRIISEMGTKFLARMAKKDDMVVVFVSTHGSPPQMDIRGDSYLVAYDTDPDDLYATGVDMQKFLSEIDKRVLCDRVVLMLDACHSGGVDPTGKGIGRVANFDANTLAEGCGQLVICSSATDQQSWESKRYANGVFTHNLLESLRKGGSNKPLLDAFESAKAGIESEVHEDHTNVNQTPILKSRWKGNDLLLAVKPVDPQKVPESVTSSLEIDSANGGKAVALSPSANPNAALLLHSSDGSGSGETKVAFVLNKEYLWNLDHKGIPFDESRGAQMLQGAKELIGGNFNDPQYQYNACQLQIQMGDLGGARDKLKNILRDQPNWWKAYLCQAYVFHRLKMEGQARDALNQAKFHNPTLPELQFETLGR